MALLDSDHAGETAVNQGILVQHRHHRGTAVITFATLRATCSLLMDLSFREKRSFQGKENRDNGGAFNG